MDVNKSVTWMWYIIKIFLFPVHSDRPANQQGTSTTCHPVDSIPRRQFGKECQQATTYSLACKLIINVVIHYHGKVLPPTTCVTTNRFDQLKK